MSCAILLHYDGLQKDDVRIKLDNLWREFTMFRRREHSEQSLAGLILHFDQMYYQIGQGDRLPVESVGSISFSMRLLYFQAIFIKVVCEYWIFSVLAFCTCIFCFGSLALDLTFPKKNSQLNFRAQNCFEILLCFSPMHGLLKRLNVIIRFSQNVEAAVKKNENVAFRLLKKINYRNCC